MDAPCESRGSIVDLVAEASLSMWAVPIVYEVFGPEAVVGSVEYGKKVGAE